MASRSTWLVASRTKHVLRNTIAGRRGELTTPPQNYPTPYPGYAPFAPKKSLPLGRIKVPFVLIARHQRKIGSHPEPA